MSENETNFSRVLLSFVNFHLSKLSPSRSIVKLTDFSTGVDLFNFLKILGNMNGIEINIKIDLKPKMNFKQRANVQNCINFLEKVGMYTHFVDVPEIVNKNEKAIKILVWNIIKFFHICLLTFNKKISEGKEQEAVVNWVNVLLKEKFSKLTEIISGAVFFKILGEVVPKNSEVKSIIESFSKNEKENISECIKFSVKKLSLPPIFFFEDTSSSDGKVLILSEPSIMIYLCYLKQFKENKSFNFNFRKNIFFFDQKQLKFRIKELMDQLKKKEIELNNINNESSKIISQMSRNERNLLKKIKNKDELIAVKEKKNSEIKGQVIDSNESNRKLIEKLENQKNVLSEKNKSILRYLDTTVGNHKEKNKVLENEMKIKSQKNLDLKKENENAKIIERNNEKLMIKFQERINGLQNELNRTNEKNKEVMEKYDKIKNASESLETQINSKISSEKQLLLKVENLEKLSKKSGEEIILQKSKLDELQKKDIQQSDIIKELNKINGDLNKKFQENTSRMSLFEKSNVKLKDNEKKNFAVVKNLQKKIEGLLKDNNKLKNDSFIMGAIVKKKKADSGKFDVLKITDLEIEENKKIECINELVQKLENKLKESVDENKRLSEMLKLKESGDKSKTAEIINVYEKKLNDQMKMEKINYNNLEISSKKKIEEKEKELRDLEKTYDKKIEDYETDLALKLKKKAEDEEKMKKVKRLVYNMDEKLKKSEKEKGEILMELNKRKENELKKKENTEKPSQTIESLRKELKQKSEEVNKLKLKNSSSIKRKFSLVAEIAALKLKLRRSNSQFKMLSKQFELKFKDSPKKKRVIRKKVQQKSKTVVKKKKF